MNDYGVYDFGYLGGYLVQKFFLIIGKELYVSVGDLCL